jgi:hypothetical protein
MKLLIENMNDKDTGYEIVENTDIAGATLPMYTYVVFVEGREVFRDTFINIIQAISTAKLKLQEFIDAA